MIEVEGNDLWCSISTHAKVYVSSNHIDKITWISNFFWSKGFCGNEALPSKFSEISETCSRRILEKKANLDCARCKIAERGHTWVSSLGFTVFYCCMGIKFSQNQRKEQRFHFTKALLSWQHFSGYDLSLNYERGAEVFET